MKDMTEVLAEITADCLERNRGKLWLAIKWRSKFEGWLKIELAEALRQRGFDPRLEITYWREGRSSKRSDISFVAAGSTFHVLLKTSNTNWRMRRVENVTRPITKNYRAILDDINSLKMPLINSRGLALAVLFPANSRTVEDLWAKIGRSSAGLTLLEERPLVRLVALDDEVGAAVLTFGPY